MHIFIATTFSVQLFHHRPGRMNQFGLSIPYITNTLYQHAINTPLIDQYILISNDLRHPPDLASVNLQLLTGTHRISSSRRHDHYRSVSSSVITTPGPTSTVSMRHQSCPLAPSRSAASVSCVLHSGSCRCVRLLCPLSWRRLRAPPTVTDGPAACQPAVRGMGAPPPPQTATARVRGDQCD